MGIKIASNCLHWASHPSPLRHSTSFHLFSLKRRPFDDPVLASNVFHRISLSSPFLTGTAASSNLSRRRSLQGLRRRSRGQQPLRRAFSANTDRLADDNEGDDEEDEEFVRRLQEPSLELQDSSNNIVVPDSTSHGTVTTSSSSVIGSRINPPWSVTRPEPPKWDDTIPASVEINANRADMPLSLRIIKKKKQCEEDVKGAGEVACCSVKKAFSSMVFIVRELQSYTLQLREALLYQNLKGIWAKVQGEMNASFVWLFQQIFSCTPTLMVWVMLLLANFTVYSVEQNFVAAASANPPVAVVDQEHRHTEHKSRFDASSAIKSFSVDGRTASVGGSGGGGGKVKPVAGATGDGRWDGLFSSYTQKLVQEADGEEKTSIWNAIVEEAHKLQASLRDESLMDSGTLRQLVSPVTVELEPEDLSIYSRTDLKYQYAVSEDPENVLLLSNFAQFLFIVLHDHDRAEYYFKRAIRMKPADAEALFRYAMFLWLARKDTDAAEETYLEAMDAADPEFNSYYAASYAHFLWNSGGEETCYPLSGGDVC